MCTLGVGGRPLLIGLGGELRCLRSLRRGGTGGVSANKSGSGPSPIQLKYYRYKIHNIKNNYNYLHYH